MITINNLWVSYSNKSVLKELNLNLPGNCIHGIMGLNGAGKTTLLNTIFGIKKYDKGKILLDGKKITKKEIAFLPAENYFYPCITGEEYLGIFKNECFDTEKWNSLFALPLDKVIGTYSTGMKKKLAILGMLKIEKPVMILDEPFNGLDIETSRLIRSILIKYKELGKIIIVSSHIIETLTNMCDIIHKLEDKKISISIEKGGFESFEKDIFNSIESKIKDIINELIK